MRFAVSVLVAGAALAIAAPVRAAAPPDSATLLWLQTEADSAWRVRVTTGRTTYRVIAPRIDLAGVTVSKKDDPPGKLVSWDAIERLDTERSGVGRGAAYGACAGLGAALGAYWSNETSDDGVDRGWAIFGIAFGVAVGATIGALLRLGSGIPTQVYP